MHMSYFGMESVEIATTSFGCLMASLSSLIFVAATIAAYHGVTTGEELVELEGALSGPGSKIRLTLKKH